MFQPTYGKPLKTYQLPTNNKNINPTTTGWTLYDFWSLWNQKPLHFFCAHQGRSKRVKTEAHFVFTRFLGGHHFLHPRVISFYCNHRLWIVGMVFLDHRFWTTSGSIQPFAGGHWWSATHKACGFPEFLGGIGIVSCNPSSYGVSNVSKLIRYTKHIVCYI